MDADLLVFEKINREISLPLKGYLERGKKSLRRDLVRAGFSWTHPAGFFTAPLEAFQLALLNQAGEIVEKIHAASLLIDDIQDDSEFRRGDVALHRKIGVAKALNIGNYLYFDALVGCSVYADSLRAQVMDAICQCLLRGHQGQALDLSFHPHQDPLSIIEHCFATMKLKTGSLFVLSLLLGAYGHGALAYPFEWFLEVGEQLGIILQIVDDLKNLKKDPQVPGKQYEDLRNGRPSYVWIWAAQKGPSLLKELREATSLLFEGSKGLSILIKTDIEEQAFIQIEHCRQVIEQSVRRVHKSQDLILADIDQFIGKVITNYATL